MALSTRCNVYAGATVATERPFDAPAVGEMLDASAGRDVRLARGRSTVNIGRP